MNRCRAGAMVLQVVILSLLIPSIVLAGGEERAEDPREEPTTEADDQVGVQTPPAGRRPLAHQSREELEAQGFVFQDTLSDRSRAHATIFAMTAGAIVPGAGHHYMGDSRTGWTLVATDLVGWSLLAGGTFLAIKPTGRERLDERRREMWFGGSGLLVTTWLVDIFGTAFSDDLGIPRATLRDQGWGVGLRYEYWRPPGLSMRHLATLDVGARGRRYDLGVQTSQELGWGMFDYKAEARWFPVVGSRGARSPTRLGVGVSGRYVNYRLDTPFRRSDGILGLHGALNVGELISHLDQMTLGFTAGVGLRSRWSLDEEEQWRSQGTSEVVPLRMYLGLNLTGQLRLTISYERGFEGWAERSARRIGVPAIQLNYRSTDRIDLEFQSIFGNGVGLTAGMRFWIGE